jgi:hypothetical protein
MDVSGMVYLLGKHTGIHWIGRWVCPGSSLDVGAEESLCPTSTENQTQIPQFPSLYMRKYYIQQIRSYVENHDYCT